MGNWLSALSFLTVLLTVAYFHLKIFYSVAYQKNFDMALLNLYRGSWKSVGSSTEQFAILTKGASINDVRILGGRGGSENSDFSK